jgi:chemotaxis protein methyltransferase CheR
MSGAADGVQLREYPFSDADFARVCRLVREQIGISLTLAKRELVYGRLSRRLRQLRLASFGDYLDRIEQGDEQETQQFRNAITTNLTAFFREQHHFDFLARELLPRLLMTNAATRRLRLWSAGCSTGEEAYSVAMVVRETLGALPGWDVRILATDVDSNVLAHARRGLYGGERLEKVDSARILRWFSRQRGSPQYGVRDEIRQLIRFNPLNLVSDWPMQGPFDVIFCRNVIIYFDRNIQRDIVGRMAGLQRNGDHLILGHSESLLSVSDRYRLVAQTAHCKVC